jgi:hypothetical protein
MSHKTVNLTDWDFYLILLQADEDIQYLCSPYRLCRYGGKEVLLVGSEPTTLTNRVNALTTELQRPYFSMYFYSIYITVLLRGTQNSTPVPVFCYCVSVDVVLVALVFGWRDVTALMEWLIDIICLFIKHTEIQSWDDDEDNDGDKNNLFTALIVMIESMSMF